MYIYFKRFSLGHQIYVMLLFPAAVAGEIAAPKATEKIAASRQDIYAGKLVIFIPKSEYIHYRYVKFTPGYLYLMNYVWNFCFLY